MRLHLRHSKSKKMWATVAIVSLKSFYFEGEARKVTHKTSSRRQRVATTTPSNAAAAAASRRAKCVRRARAFALPLRSFCYKFGARRRRRQQFQHRQVPSESVLLLRVQRKSNPIMKVRKKLLPALKAKTVSFYPWSLENQIQVARLPQNGQTTEQLLSSNK